MRLGIYPKTNIKKLIEKIIFSPNVSLNFKNKIKLGLSILNIKPNFAD